MARTTDLTKTKIAQAVEQLKAEGKKPTLRNVREMIGYGSFGTIQKLLTEHLSETADEVTEVAIPTSLLNALKTALAETTAMAKAEMAESQNELQQDIQQLTKENTQLMAFLEEAKKTQDDLIQTIGAEQAEKEAAWRDLRYWKDTAEKLQEKYEALLIQMATQNKPNEEKPTEQKPKPTRKSKTQSVTPTTNE